MGLEDLFGFSTSDYAEKIGNRYSYSDDELADNIYKKRRQCAGSAFGIGAGIAAAAHTGGASLAGVALSGRNRSVAKQKLEILEDEWVRRGFSPLDKRLRDTVIPVAIGAAAVGISMGVSHGLDSAGSAAIHHAADTTQQYAYSSTMMVPATVPGVESVMLPNGAVESFVTGVPGYVPYTFVGYGVEQVTGNVAGQMAALHAGSAAASKGASWGAKKVAENHLARGDSKLKHRSSTYSSAPPSYHDSDRIKGRIRVVADFRPWSGWLGHRSSKGTYLKASEKSDAVHVWYNPSEKRHDAIMVHAEDDSWLAVTWPRLASSEWSHSKSYSANLAKATKHRGRLDSTAKGDEGATQNLVWTTNDNNHLSVTYHDDNGVDHTLVVCVCNDTGSIRLVRSSAKSQWLDRNEDYCHAVLIFVPS